MPNEEMKDTGSQDMKSKDVRSWEIIEKKMSSLIAETFDHLNLEVGSMSSNLSDSLKSIQIEVKDMSGKLNSVSEGLNLVYTKIKDMSVKS